MQDISRQNLISESYPQLTVENVKYWYWEVEPHWSAVDIAKAIGCSDSNVYYFMHKNNIPVRSAMEATINRFNCPQKYKDYRKQRSSPEFRKHQSIVSFEAWQDSIRRAKYSESMREVTLKKISEFQKLLLLILLQHARLFLTDFIRITNLEGKKLNLALSSIYKRELVTRTKEYNKNTDSNYKYNYRYEITDKGRELLLLNMTSASFNYKKLLETIQARYNQPTLAKSPERKRKNSSYIHIGKNQQAILHVLKQQNCPLFLVEFVSLMTIPEAAISKSLRHLYKRGVVSRKKELNRDYTGNIQNAKQYLYRLTENGKELLFKKFGWN